MGNKIPNRLCTGVKEDVRQITAFGGKLNKTQNGGKPVTLLFILGKSKYPTFFSAFKNAFFPENKVKFDVHL